MEHDPERRIDMHLASAMDELLSLASLGTVHGRPELALRASVAIDQLLSFLPDAPERGATDPFPDLPGDQPHAQH